MNEEFETKFEALMHYNWNMNNMVELFQKIYQMGSVSGDAYVFLYPDVEKGFVEYTVLDTRVVVPKFVDGDYNQVESYRVITPLIGTNRKDDYVAKVTEYKVGLVLEYKVKEVSDEAEHFEETQEEYDLDFIPIVHIQNIAMSVGYGGRSDLEDIIKLNKLFNEMSADFKDILDYYLQPTTVITGGTLGQVKRGINQIWSGLPADARVFNLNMDADLSSMLEFLKMLKNGMHDMSGVPEEILSKVQHISNTSAAALEMLFQPIIQMADTKSITYGAGVDEINRKTCLIYKKVFPAHPLWQQVTATAPNIETDDLFFYRFRAKAHFIYNLPKDRLSQLNEATIEISTATGSRREIMQRMGKKNIPKLLKEIESDQNERAKWAAKAQPQKPVLDNGSVSDAKNVHAAPPKGV